MSKNYMNDSQASEIIKYISDTMKLPLIGAGGGFAPLGMYGFSCDYVLTPPQGWLFADGSIYNIADYPEYAALLASQHGRANIYGGDGVTTFATKDLRGEFIRGWGQNSHANQGDGGELGEHQDATQHNIMYQGTSQAVYIQDPNDSNRQFCANPDSRISINGTYIPFNRSASGTSTGYPSITSRPTNTSVAFLVKVTLSDAEINAFNVYTPREHQVAWWEEEIDGVWKRKPVYEKRFDGLSFGSNSKTWLNSGATIQDVSLVTSAKAIRTLNNTVSYAMSFRSSNNIIEYYAFEPYTAFDILIVRYTKSTDDWQTS